MPPETTLIIRPEHTASVYSIVNVNIDSYSEEAVIGEDQMTPIGARLQVSGTGLMSIENWTDWRQTAKDVSPRLDLARLGVAPQYLISMENQESMINGPFCKLTGTQVAGTSLVIVRWELSDQRAYCPNNAVSHTWVQRHSLDARGHVTRTIQGMFQANKAATGTAVAFAGSSGYANVAPWADLFRNALIPDVPDEGWRRESQEFYYNPMSTALGYVIVDKQTVSDLPDGVRVGDMDFQFERTLENVGVANLRFSCDLQGDLSLKGIANTTGNRHLIRAAIDLSKTRINATYGNIIITRMSVTEREMLTGFAIRFELDAQCYPSQSQGTNAMVALAYMVGQKFNVVRTVGRAVPPYGAAVPVGQVNKQYYMVPHWVNNALNNPAICQTAGIPAANTSFIAGTNAYGEISINIVASETDLNTEFDGKFASSQAQGQTDSDGFTTIIGHNVSVTSVSYTGGFVRLNPMCATAKEIVLQMTRPKVRVAERVEIARVNEPPPKTMRPLPDGAFLVSDNWDVSYGKYDAQGQRVFTGIYNRTYELYDADANTGFATFGSGIGTITTWSAPDGQVLSAISPFGTSASQSTGSTVFDAAGSVDAYPTPSQPFLG